MIALPGELLQLVFSFIRQRKDATACTLVCKTWNTFATIRLYEAGVKLEALRTLWMRPDLAALVKDIKLVWEDRRRFELDISMDDSELLDILEDEKTARALREGYTSAYAVLLIKLLPSLRTLNVTPHAFRSFLFRDVFPAIDILCDPSRIRPLRHLTFLQVSGYKGGMGNQHVLTPSLLARCMILPSLKFLTFHIVYDGLPWEDEIERFLPSLYGTSSVEHLRLQRLTLMTVDSFAPLLRIPRRLRTFGLTDFRPHENVALGVIVDTLQHAQQSLEVLEICCDYVWSLDLASQRLTNLHHFLLLTHLTVPITFITGIMNECDDCPAYCDLLPPSLIFWNIGVKESLLFDMAIKHPLFIEELLSLPSLKQLCVTTDRDLLSWDLSAEMNQRWHDAGTEITYDKYDSKQHIIVDKNQQPIFGPGDWKDLGGCYGSPFMIGAPDQ
jgi:hypothetical protein